MEPTQAGREIPGDSDLQARLAEETEEDWIRYRNRKNGSHTPVNPQKERLTNRC